MESPVVRFTLKDTVTRTGRGIHTGEVATVHLHPAQAGKGIVFRCGEVTLPARAGSVIDTARCTVLGKDGARVSTVEHLLSACAGCGVTDLIVEIDGPELPIGDGSAAIWVEALLEGQRIENGPLAVYHLREPVIVYGRGGAFVAAYPAATLAATVSITFDHPLIQTQLARYDRHSLYTEEVAPARTFGFIEEVEALLKAGLAKGGSLDNAVVIYPDRYSAPLRFPDELVRHKLLDVLGDLLLATGETLPVADIIAVKPSHRLNTELAKAIAVQRGDV